VGDSYDSLLRIVPRQYGEVVQQIFDPPLYLKVGKREVNQIEIDIRTAKGEPYPLEGKVYLTLHLYK
jgi:hypothetical protein